jgi:hypothetical protein
MFKKKLGKQKTFDSSERTGPDSVKQDDFNTPAAILNGFIRE